MSIQKLLVVGAGTMGGGIAQTAANAGDTVFLHDAAPGAAERARERIAQSLERAMAKGYVTEEDKARILGNLHPVASLQDAREAHAVIEAVKEDLEVKQDIFAKLEEAFGEEVFLWTNTSMISITLVAEKLRHPGRVAGTHFFNPVPRMQLVEVIPGKRTAENTVRVAMETMRRWGKTPILAPDTPGFIVNRLFDAFLAEALTLHEEGVSAEDMDTAIRLGLNFPMGPLELMDLVGLDIVLDCGLSMARGMGRSEEEAAVSPTLRRLVREGKLGRKTGEGFYSYSK